MNEVHFEALVEAVRDLGFGSHRISEMMEPGVGEKLAMEVGRLADSVVLVASALESIAEAVNRQAFR